MERFLHHRIDNGLHRCGQPIDLDGLLDHIVPPHDQSVSGKDLVVGRAVALVTNRFQVDLVNPRRFASPRGAHQVDVLRFGCRNQPTRVVDGIQNGF